MKKLVAAVLSMALILSIVCVTDTNAEETKVTLAQWSYSAITTEESAADNDLADSYGKKSGYVATAGAVTEGAIMTGSVDGSSNRKFQYSDEAYTVGEASGCQPVFAGKKASGEDAAITWGTTENPPYVLVQASTKGYKNIAFSATIGASKKGAVGYTLSYSIDGENYTAVGEEKRLGTETSRVMTKLFDEVALPEAAQDAEKVYLKLTFSDTTIAGGSLAGNTGGETAINDIIVSGVDKVSPTPTPTIVPTQAPTITPTVAPTQIPIIAPSTPQSNTTTTTKTAIKKLKLNKKKLTLKKGKSYTLKVTKTPAKASGKLTWKSSKKKVATVTSKGKIKAKKKGKTVITVKSTNGKKATCKVTVK